MTAASVSGLLGLAGWPPALGSGADGALPGHPLLGALFLFAGGLLVVETLAGPAWRRERWRTMLWPAALLASGLGMLVVSDVQSSEKTLHLTLAILLLLGGFFEARYRLGQISRSTADGFVIPALIVGGLIAGPMHASGPLLHSAAADTHLLVGVMGFVLAGVRLSQVRYSATAALDGAFAVGVMLLGLSLLLVQPFHAGQH